MEYHETERFKGCDAVTYNGFTCDKRGHHWQCRALSLYRFATLDALCDAIDKRQRHAVRVSRVNATQVVYIGG